MPTSSTYAAALFDALPLPAFALDADAVLVAWNAAAARAFGWTSSELLGKRPAFATAGALALLERLAAGAPADASLPLDLPFVARDGSLRRARLRISPLPGGGAVFVDGSGVDRPDLERTEPLESPLLQTVLDAIPTPIWFKTADGIYRGCNLAFEQALGKTRGELIGRGVEATGPARITSVYRDADRALFASGGTQFYEGELRRSDGEIRRVTFHKAASVQPM